MLLCELSLTNKYTFSLVNIKPFIYLGYSSYYVLKSEWGETCDDLYEEGIRQKAIQCTVSFTNKLLLVSSQAECEANESTWYFDEANQKFIIHTPHENSTLTTEYDYGFSFGLSEYDVVYINDYEYLPLIKSGPNLDRETDYTNSKQPTGSVASITLKNMEYVNTSGERIGRLDFLINEKLYNNDVFIYRYNQETQELIPLSYKYIEEITIGEEDVVIDLQDRRFS